MRFIIYRVSDRNGRRGPPCEGAVCLGWECSWDADDDSPRVWAIDIEPAKFLEWATALGGAIVLKMELDDHSFMGDLPDLKLHPTIEIYDGYRE